METKCPVCDRYRERVEKEKNQERIHELLDEWSNHENGPWCRKEKTNVRS